MTQRRLRPSQGGRFLPPVVPALLETTLVIERDEYVRAPTQEALLLRKQLDRWLEDVSRFPTR